MRYLFIGNICFSIFILYNIHNSEACHYLQISTKKTWNSTVVVPRFEAVALPNVLEQQREAHADMLFYTPTDDAYTYTPPRRLVYNKPVGHLSLLSPEYILETATFQSVRTKRYNKRLFSIKYTTHPDITQSAWYSIAKVRIIFYINK